MDKLEITDEMLQKSCKKLENKTLENLPLESDIEHKFSKRFNKKMNKLIKYDRRPHFMNSVSKYLKRVAVVFLILIVGVFALSMNVEDIRAKVMSAITQIYEVFEKDEKSEETKEVQKEVQDENVRELYNMVIENDDYKIEMHKITVKDGNAMIDVTMQNKLDSYIQVKLDDVQLSLYYNEEVKDVGFARKLNPNETINDVIKIKDVSSMDDLNTKLEGWFYINDMEQYFLIK